MRILFENPGFHKVGLSFGPKQKVIWIGFWPDFGQFFGQFFYQGFDQGLQDFQELIINIICSFGIFFALLFFATM